MHLVLKHGYEHICISSPVVQRSICSTCDLDVNLLHVTLDLFAKMAKYFLQITMKQGIQAY